MKLAKSLLLGSAATLVAVAGASAADLPSKKAAPVNYVKVCDAYGAGFFYIPGTETCVKIGGRVRADYVGSRPQALYSAAGATTATAPTVLRAKDAVHAWGWEARGRVDLDARTATPYGTVQAVTSIRLNRTSGLIGSDAGPGLTSQSAAATLEAAYIRFAGFTFGAARDNFSFMPSTFYGAGHWASFANGAKQAAYTAVLGGGLSATLAIQDPNDTIFTPVVTTGTSGTVYSYNRAPQFNARVDFEQAWGTISAMGAVGFANGVTNSASYDEQKATYAAGAGLKLNLPMIAAGDVLYLNGAYARGMHEYTIGWTYFKSSDVRRNVGGYVSTDASYVYAANGIELPKSWNVAALLTHYWAPEWRHSFLATAGKIDATATQKALVWNGTSGVGDATVWNIGTQLAFVPTKDFEIGVEVLYARVSQDIRRTLATGTDLVTKEKEGNLTGRLRVERTF